MRKLRVIGIVNMQNVEQVVQAQPQFLEVFQAVPEEDNREIKFFKDLFVSAANV